MKDHISTLEPYAWKYIFEVPDTFDMLIAVSVEPNTVEKSATEDEELYISMDCIISVEPLLQANEPLSLAAPAAGVRMLASLATNVDCSKVANLPPQAISNRLTTA